MKQIREEYEHVCCRAKLYEADERCGCTFGCHRAFLDEHYARGVFLLSGPKEPRTGGIIVVDAQTEEEARSYIEQDPFFVHHVAEYHYIAFRPTKADPSLQARLFQK